MPITIEDCHFHCGGTAISVPQGADMSVTNTGFFSNKKSIEVRDAPPPRTMLSHKGKSCTIPGNWTENDLKEFIALIVQERSAGEVATQSKIGGFLRKKIGDPTAFAAEITTIFQTLFR